MADRQELSRNYDLTPRVDFLNASHGDEEKGIVAEYLELLVLARQLERELAARSETRQTTREVVENAISASKDHEATWDEMTRDARLRRKGWNAAIKRCAELVDGYAELTKSMGAQRAADAIRALHSTDEAPQAESPKGIGSAVAGQAPAVASTQSSDKPNGPTPRTDAEEVYYSEIVTGRDAGLYWVKADFARKLEVERNSYALAAQKAVEKNIVASAIESPEEAFRDGLRLGRLGYSTIEEVIEQEERDPACKAALDKAREWVKSLRRSEGTTK